MKPFIQWWNLEIGFPQDHIFMPTTPYPKIVIPIWKKYFVPFFLEVDNFKYPDPKSYWEQIAKVFKEYFSSQTVPDPYDHFEDFVKLFYDLKDIMSPRSVKQTISLLQSHSEACRNKFIVYKAPIVIKHPLLYMNTIFKLMTDNDSIWTSLSKNYDYNLAFFGLYCTVVKESHSENKFLWNYRMKIVEILRELLLCLPRDDDIFTDNCGMLISSITKMAHNAPTEIQVSIIMLFFSLMRMISKKSSFEAMKSYFNDFIDTINPDSDAFPILFHFSLRSYTRSNYISIIKLHKCLRKRNFKSADDFQMLYKIAQHTQLSALLTTIYKQGLKNMAFLRTSFHFICLILTENIKNSNCTEWAITFIRRIVLFPILAKITKTYEERSLIVLEFLSDLSNATLNKKVKTQLDSSIAACREISDCPPYYWYFVTSDGIPDRQTTRDYQSFKKKKNLSALMNNYPFHAFTSEFLKPNLQTPVTKQKIKPKSKEANDASSFASASSSTAVRKRKKSVPVQRPNRKNIINPNIQPDLSVGDPHDNDFLSMINMSDDDSFDDKTSSAQTVQVGKQTKKKKVTIKNNNKGNDNQQNKNNNSRPKTAKPPLPIPKRNSLTNNLSGLINKESSTDAISASLSSMKKKRSKSSKSKKSPIKAKKSDPIDSISTIEEARQALGEVTELTRSQTLLISLDPKGKVEKNRPLQKSMSDEVEPNAIATKTQRKAEIAARKALQMDSSSMAPVRLGILKIESDHSTDGDSASQSTGHKVLLKTNLPISSLKQTKAKSRRKSSSPNPPSKKKSNKKN